MFLQTLVVAQMILDPLITAWAALPPRSDRCPVHAQAVRLCPASPLQPTVISPTEAAAIRDMHRLGIDMAEASQRPCDLLPEDWDYMSDEQRATATKFWTTRRNSLRLQIADAATASPSFYFSDCLKTSGAGPVYVVRWFRSTPCGDKSKQLYQVGPPELSEILKDETYSGISGYFEYPRESFPEKL